MSLQSNAANFANILADLNNMDFLTKAVCNGASSDLQGAEIYVGPPMAQGLNEQPNLHR